MTPACRLISRKRAQAGRLRKLASFQCVRYPALLIAGTAALLATAPDAEATCRDRNFVDGLSLALNTGGRIRAASSDGVAYDRIESTDFRATIGIDLCHPGALDGFELRLGACTGHRGVCRSMPQMHYEQASARDFHKGRTFSFAIPPDSDLGTRILNRCNARVNDARGAARDIVLDGNFHADVTLAVDTRRDHGRIGTRDFVEPLSTIEEYSKTKTFRTFVSAACAPLPQPVKAPPKVSEAALSVATSGDICPKPAAADVIIAAEAPRTVFYKIERGNGTTTTAGWIEGEVKKQKGPTGSKSAFLRAEHDLGGLDPGTRKFRLWVDGWDKTPWRHVDVQCPPFKVTSAWLTYEVENKATCPKNVEETATFKATRPGKAPFVIKTQGGLVVHSGNAKFEREGTGYVAKVRRPSLSMNAFDSDMMALITNQSDANSGWVRLRVECLEVLSGTLDLRAFGASRCEGEAALSIRTSMPGNVPYRLACTGGRSWTGVAQAQKTGADTYLGIDTKRFDVSNNEQVNCALNTIPPMPAKVLALRGHTYECHKPTGASGSSDLNPQTRPEDPPPPDRTGSDKATDPPRRISCAGGVVKRRKCLCPRTHKAVHAGKNAWRCIKFAVIDPPRADGGNDSSAASARPKAGKARRNAAAERRRLKALKRTQQTKRKRRSRKAAR